MPPQLPPTKAPLTVITTDGKTLLTKVMPLLPLELPDRTKPCVSMVIDLVGIANAVPLGSVKLLVSVIVELGSVLAFAALMAAINCVELPAV